jgi:hypothetical protein
MKPFSAFAAVLLALVALVQLLRFILEWPVSVNGLNIPIWVSPIAVVLFGGISVMLWRERRR